MALFHLGAGGGECVEYGYKGKGVLMHMIGDGHGMPLRFSVTSAKGDERKQLVALVNQLPVIRKFHFFYADKGYDANWIRLYLVRKNWYPMIPRRKFATSPRVKTNPMLKKLNCRWKIERTFAWIKRKYRRIQTRWERRMCYWEGFVSVAMIMLWVEKLVG
ncbi:hypothetical protein LCGC14_2947100 [marine sediment metagenome]|uniref:Transposase IS4-like domain-containing protein n=1 Tax=marine sediment metagenome TaxID=412755 RepID=A0A0F8XG44_9ZZZZ